VIEKALVEKRKTGVVKRRNRVKNRIIRFLIHVYKRSVVAPIKENQHRPYGFYHQREIENILEQENALLKVFGFQRILDQRLVRYSDTPFGQDQEKRGERNDIQPPELHQQHDDDLPPQRKSIADVHRGQSRHATGRSRREKRVRKRQRHPRSGHLREHQ